MQSMLSESIGYIHEYGRIQSDAHAAVEEVCCKRNARLRALPADVAVACASRATSQGMQFAAGKKAPWLYSW